MASVTNAQLMAKLQELQQRSAPLRDVGRYRRGEVAGQEGGYDLLGAPKRTLMEQPAAGYVRAIAENLGATPEVGLGLERAAVGTASGIGALTLLAALQDLYGDRTEAPAATTNIIR
jgi:hypothetical protein